MWDSILASTRTLCSHFAGPKVVKDTIQDTDVTYSIPATDLYCEDSGWSKAPLGLETRGDPVGSIELFRTVAILEPGLIDSGRSPEMCNTLSSNFTKIRCSEWGCRKSKGCVYRDTQ